MASSDQRDNERVPTFLRVRLRFANVDAFIEKYSTNVSLGGVFIQSRSPKPPGTTLKFELALENGESLIKGEGQVTWVREFDPDSPGQPFGMGVRFTHLDAKSRALVERAVAHRQARSGTGETPSPFTPAVPRTTAAARTPAPALRARTPAPVPVAVALAPAPPPSTGSPPLSAGNRDADAALDALMREAGLDQGKIARATARAAAKVAAETEPGALGALLRRAPPSAAAAAEDASHSRAADSAGSRRTSPGPLDAPEPFVVLSAAPPPPAPAALPEAFADEPVLPPADIDEMLGGFTPTPPPVPMSAEGMLVGSDLEMESLGGEAALDAGSARGPVEITAVGTPPRFDESPAEEPLIFPDREVTTPPPEATSTFIAADGTVTPAASSGTEESEPDSGLLVAPAIDATERWAAASGPETANLEEDLVAALDSVMDRRPEDPEVAGGRAATSPPQVDKNRGTDEPVGKKKGILGRIFRKKA